MREVCFLYQFCSTACCLDVIYSQDFQQSSYFQRNIFVLLVLPIKPKSCLCFPWGTSALKCGTDISSLSHSVLLANL